MTKKVPHELRIKAARRGVVALLCLIFGVLISGRAGLVGHIVGLILFGLGLFVDLLALRLCAELRHINTKGNTDV